ncbi:hypothetical protein BU23DRAFT_432289, partial [Bimuria novae-zelandiae CBS 107.79]
SSFYFWNPGSTMQKSLQGLLQSLLHGILSACPDMILHVCKERLDRRSHTALGSESWTMTELKGCFARIQAADTISKRKFYFHIDGLDEFNGNHTEIVTVLKTLASSLRVKLCLSSRPWNAFELAFSSHPSQKLYLEDFTKSDIRIFAGESLTSELQTSQVWLPQTFCTGLVEKIVERAKGVFLWVHLVVRSLCDGFVNGDPSTLLYARLNTLPTDLEALFASILASIDPIYREHMAITFFVALRIPALLRIIDYSFLDEEDGKSGFELDFKPLDDEEIRHRVLRTQRQLVGRFKGLLEYSASKLHSNPL